MVRCASLVAAALLFAAPGSAQRVKNTTPCPSVNAACCMPGHPSAAFACERILQADPRNPFALYYRGSEGYGETWNNGPKHYGISVGKDAKMLIADYEGALANARKRRQKLPDEAVVYERLGYGYASLSEWERAAASWQKALEARPALNERLEQRIAFARERLRERKEIRASPPTACGRLSYWSCEEVPGCRRSDPSLEKSASRVVAAVRSLEPGYLGCIKH